MLKPPSGIVTFLFSDIEGSTQRWERQPALMQRAFARQEAIMRAAMAAHGGYVYKMIGDAFQVAFANASDAVAAALEAQLALHSEPWGEIGPIRVRMALHTGETEERGDDYVGPLLNRVARLMSAGYGGQVLLTQAARDMAQDRLPHSASLRDMGERRLKDLIHPERVYQISAPGLPHDFPPLKTLDRRPNNLPAQLTSFVGREREMAEVKRLLNTSRLLTLTGAGGAGKTRLALQVAADLVDDFEDGVFLVELAPLADPALVPQVIAAAVGVREEAGRSMLDALCAALREREILLLLDNCEHLVAACANAVHAVLRAAPGVKIVTSSREPLRIEGETTYRVPSLQTPDPKAHLIVGQLLQFEAVRLFVDRAAAAQPGFAITPANAPAVAQVCHRLDGIPLAIELAAARVKSLAVDKIAARLDDRFRLLTGGNRAALPRQQTLRAAIDWSYSLLSALPPSERALLRRLAVFAGAWSLEAAEVVCVWDAPNDDDALREEDVLDLITSLADKSLILPNATGEGVRYRMLETIREYALGRLREAGEEDLARARHAAHFFDVSAIFEPQLRGGNQKACLDRLELDYDDLRYAFDWLLAHDAERALHLAGALGSFWDLRGHFAEGRETLARAISAGPQADAAPRAKASRWLSLLALRQGDYVPARAMSETALDLSAAINDEAGVAEALTHLGWIAYLQGDFDAAEAQTSSALITCRRLGDKSGCAYALTVLGNVAYGRGDDASAKQAYEQALALERSLGNRIGVSKLLNNMGSVADAQGDYAAARGYYEESLVIKRDLGDRWGMTYSLVGLGNIALAQSDYAAAQGYFNESLQTSTELGMKNLAAYSLEGLGEVARANHDLVEAARYLESSLSLRRTLGDKEGIATCLEGFGKVHLDRGDAALAVELFSAAQALREAIGFSMMDAERSEFDHWAEIARERLDAGDYELAWRTGQEYTLEQTIAHALGAISV
jgi:predicted ATPase/class 3 adenylate cyclase/Tfp pilus assembly protein PilF